MTTHTTKRLARRLLALALGGLALVAAATVAGAPAAHAGQPPALTTLPTPMPDLVIRGAFFITQDGETYLSLGVRNAGSAPAGPFANSVTTQTGAPLVPTMQILLVGLNPGATTVNTYKLPPCVPYGLLSISIVVDAGNVVAESNEGNNTATENFIYGPSCP